MNPSVFARLLALAAGIADVVSGILFLASPALALRLFGAPAPEAATLPYLRFVGVFVFCVGASYLWALLDPLHRLPLLFSVTLLFRIGCGLFTLIAVWTGIFPLGWLIVTAASAFLVGGQLWCLYRRPELFD